MKRLYKSRKYKVIDGVCGGIAEYFDVDPVIIRLIFVIGVFVGGSGIIAYIIGMIIIPSSKEQAYQDDTGKDEEVLTGEVITKQTETDVNVQEETHDEIKHKDSGRSGLIFGIVLIAIGAFFILDRIPFFYQPLWWLRRHLWDVLIPAVMIILGASLIFRKKK